MDLGDEVSIKIKSAIKARLKELGIVWDQELPDYVMVLIANKKTKEQMEKDLTIFLGSHTSGFTDWLHNVLKKLEECAISRGFNKKKEEDKNKSKRKSSDDKLEERKRLKLEEDFSQESLDSYSSSSEPEALVPIQPSPVTIDEEEMDDLDDDISATSFTITNTNSRPSVDFLKTSERLGVAFDRMSSTIEIVKKKDLANYVEEKQKPREKIEIIWNELNSDSDNLPKDQNGFGSLSSASDTRSEKRHSRSKSKNRDIIFPPEKHVSVLKRCMKENIQKEQECKDYTDLRNIYPWRDSEEKRNGFHNKSRINGKGRNEKNKKSRHRSGSVDVKEDNRLSSLVKVTPRPVRPPSMQPSSNLILKAVAEAQKSIATSSLPQPDDKILPDNEEIQVLENNSVENEYEIVIQQKEEKDNVKRKTVYRKKKAQPFHRENISVTLLNDRVIADKIKEGQQDLNQDTGYLTQENQINDGMMQCERFTITLASDDNDSLPASDYEDDDKQKELPEENYIEEDQNILINEQTEISSTIMEVEESPEDTESSEFTSYKFDRRRLGPRVVPDPNTILSFKKQKRKKNEKTINLKGSNQICRDCCMTAVLPSKLKKSKRKNEQNTINLKSPNQIYRNYTTAVLPSKLKKSKRKNEQNTINLKSPNQIYRNYTTAVLPSKCLATSEDTIMKTILNDYNSTEKQLDENGKLIKCKYWPACEIGEACRFFHPSEYCRALPNCKFGLKCLYYHPPCKFGQKCMKISCPFNHVPVTTNPTTSQATPPPTKVPLAPTNSQICMFYPNCNKIFCPYQHIASLAYGKPCKFGFYCTKTGCEFDHSNHQQTSRNPYKWVAQNSV